MAVSSPSDVLFYDEARFPKPPAGGVPVFTRSGAVQLLDGGRIYREITADKVRRERLLASDSPGLSRPTRAMLLELSSTPVNDDSVLFDNTSAWSRGTFASESAVPSIFQSLPTGGEARLFKGDGTTGARLDQTVGTFSASLETIHAIIEDDGSGPRVKVRLFDDTDNVDVAVLGYSFSSDSIYEETGSGDGGVRVIREPGPNGPKIIHMWKAGNGTTGNTRRLLMSWDDNAQGNNAIFHYCAHEEHLFPSSPVLFTGSPVARPTESFHYQGAGADGTEAFCGYVRIPAVIAGLSTASNERIISRWPASSNPRYFIDNPTADRLRLFFRDSGGNDSSATAVASASPEDLVEIAFNIASDGSTYIVVSVNGGADNSATGAATTNGLSELALADLYLNSHPDGSSKGAQSYERLAFVKASAVDAALDGTADAAFMDEMRAVRMSLDGQLV